jgi:4-aminobutyrate aminotransferase-like enzyme
MAMATTHNVTNAMVFERPKSHVRSYCPSVDAIFDTASGSIMRGIAGRDYIDFLWRAFAELRVRRPKPAVKHSPDS